MQCDRQVDFVTVLGDKSDLMFYFERQSSVFLSINNLITDVGRNLDVSGVYQSN